MLWEDVFEIPFCHKLKIFLNYTLEAFLNISKALIDKALQTFELTLEYKLCHGKIFLKSPSPQTQKFLKFYLRSFLNISKALIDRALQISESTLEDKLCYGKMFLKSSFHPNSKFSKILL
jgi:hypothetical protein